jgi:ribosomal protein L30/L7E
MSFVIAEKLLIEAVLDRLTDSLTVTSMPEDEALVDRLSELLKQTQAPRSDTSLAGFSPRHEPQTFLVREGTKRVEDPTATHHPCSHCGNMMTLALYDIVDGYVLPKSTPADSDVQSEHTLDCVWRQRGGLGFRLKCRHCLQECNSDHTCERMIESMIEHYTKKIVNDTSEIRGQLAAINDAVIVLTELVTAQTFRKAVKSPIGRPTKKTRKAKPAGKRR